MPAPPTITSLLTGTRPLPGLARPIILLPHPLRWAVKPVYAYTWHPFAGLGSGINKLEASWPDAPADADDGAERRCADALIEQESDSILLPSSLRLVDPVHDGFY